jgi:hypothetical protein
VQRKSLLFGIFRAKFDIHTDKLLIYMQLPLLHEGNASASASEWQPSSKNAWSASFAVCLRKAKHRDRFAGTHWQYLHCLPPTNASFGFHFPLPPLL